MIFGFILSTIFVPDISGAATAPRWALAGVLLPILLMLNSRGGVESGHAPKTDACKLVGGTKTDGLLRQTDSSAGRAGPCQGSGRGFDALSDSAGVATGPRGLFTAVHLFGLLFIWYAAISLPWSPQVYDGLDALIKLVIITEAFVYGSNLVSLRPLIIGFGLGMWVSSLVILTGLDVPHVTDNAGLFANSNSMGEIAGLVLVAAVFYRGHDTNAPWSIDRLFNGPRVWWLIPGILPAFVMAQCRGAFVAVAIAFMIWLWGKSRWFAAVLGACAVLAIVGTGSIGSIHDRLTLWTDTLPHLSLLGHGIGSFYTLYPLYGSIDTLIQRPEHLHNDWLEYGFEVGIVGVGCLAAFAFFVLRRSRVGEERYILASLAIEACFGFPLHMAATVILGAIVAGHASGRGSRVRDVFDDGRMGICRGLFPDFSRIGS